MKRMEKQEFIDRHLAVARAKRMYWPHLTNNITLAFNIYQTILAEQERDLFITNSTRRQTLIDGYVRPKCPECDFNLGLEIINTPKGRANRYGWKTVWRCPVCLNEQFSKKTVQDWMKELKKETDVKRREGAWPWGCMRTIY